eukprot:TRINITY_DN28664_c0_g1_i2.p1 TRINITY_DN28664_c0_g1~~TRINITY_DN28664_c0_g1_i2.p1  ORF type:complete len:189 (+),score=17.76 TRINITY_DN28664_c0_g1_i2:197-763(+)
MSFHRCIAVISLCATGFAARADLKQSGEHKAIAEAVETAVEQQNSSVDAASADASRQEVRASAGLASAQSESLAVSLSTISMLTQLRKAATGEYSCAHSNTSSALDDLSDMVSGWCPDQGPRAGCGCGLALGRCNCMWYQECFSNGWTSNWDIATQMAGMCCVATWVYAAAIIVPSLLCCAIALAARK